MASAVDVFVAYKFIQILTTSWEKQEAFEFGIIDKNGKALRKSNTLKTSAEKNSYTIFHRLIFSIKRLLEKLPFGKTKLGSFAAGLFLLKEESSLDTEFYDFLDEEDLLIINGETDAIKILKKRRDDNILDKGRYILKHSLFFDECVEALSGDIVEVKKTKKPITQICGKNVYKVKHLPTNFNLLVTNEDIQKIS